MTLVGIARTVISANRLPISQLQSHFFDEHICVILPEPYYTTVVGSHLLARKKPGARNRFHSPHSLRRLFCYAMWPHACVAYSGQKVNETQGHSNWTIYSLFNWFYLKLFHLFPQPPIINHFLLPQREEENGKRVTWRMMPRLARVAMFYICSRNLL